LEFELDPDSKKKYFEPPFHLTHWKWLRLSFLVALDILVVSVSYYLAYFLRLDSFTLDDHILSFWTTLPIAVLVHILVFSGGGVYRQVLKYVNFDSALLVGKCVAVASLTTIGVSFVFQRELMPPRSIPIIFAIVTFLLIVLSRFSWRVLSHYISYLKPEEKDLCVIYGAGAAGDLLLRHVHSNPGFPYKPIGVIDDDPNKKRRVLHGLKIFGSGEMLESLVKKYKFRYVIITINSAPGKKIREIVERCRELGVEALIMPSLGNVLGSDLVQPRSVDIKDLLRREPRSVNADQIRSFFYGSSVLITGAGGTIGSELCRQVLACSPRQLVFLDSSEYNLFKIDEELKRLSHGTSTKLIPTIGSVSQARCVEKIFSQYKPTHVLHAAAYKHVPLMESNISEAIINNVGGTKVLVEASKQHEVAHFLLISTDKAVRPTNVMGATKRCCEQVLNHNSFIGGSKTKFASVRFGNVLGSSGSVVPTFVEQIKAGGPVTVTHPEITRFFMLIPEAVGLVLQSASIAKGGETFILDMGEPIKILDMAEQLILLSGKKPHKEIEIKFTGLRPGEKLYEEIIKDDAEEHTVIDGVYVTKPRNTNSQKTLLLLEELVFSANEDNIHRCLELLGEVGDLRRPPKTEFKVETDDNEDNSESYLLN
jgi:FlaA1/EpsC-like NDP-sugar epimerase